jgi:threonine dehydratase
MNPAPTYPTLAEIRAAATALREVAAPTPLVEVAAFTSRIGVPIWVKCEQWQPIGAFKVRGAFTAIRRLEPDARARGIVTHSSGNHGQAVAFVARHFGIRAVVVMPRTAPAIKVEGVRRHGGEVVFTEPVSSVRLARAAELAHLEGLTLVQPYDDSDIILGQATCALEILEERPDVATLLTPIGGGGLLAGTCLAVRALRPDMRVVGVEPEGAPKLSMALRAGEPVTLEKAESVADGLLPLSVGRLTFQHIQPVVADAVTVTDGEIGRAVRALYWEAGMRIEPSGAVGIAALLTGKVRPSGPSAVVLSGGNVDPALFVGMVAR